ncbi:LIM [Musa troglodytarum]|uniref:LIM n=1 Tax=Musa troglodytarum TaxID=320322 RepID=A0A9E7FVJ4_9LILI|nr:LIM [Musa troglodytarum]
MSFTGTQDKCNACDKTVHFIELLTADGVPYHETCFKCSHCKATLSVTTLSRMASSTASLILSSCSRRQAASPKSSQKPTVEDESYHKTCFECSHGGRTLTPSSYAALDGILCCKRHFAQLFKEKGSYNHLVRVASLKRGLNL